MGTSASNGGEAPAKIRAERDVRAVDRRVDVVDLARFAIAILPCDATSKRKQRGTT